MKTSTTATDAVQIDVFGEACGSDGYTTPAEARAMARHLRVKPGARVLDIGSGAGWPGLRVAEITGAHAVLTDVPRDGLVRATERALRRALRRKMHGCRRVGPCSSVPRGQLRRDRPCGRDVLTGHEALRAESVRAIAPAWRADGVHHARNHARDRG